MCVCVCVCLYSRTVSTVALCLTCLKQKLRWCQQRLMFFRTAVRSISIYVKLVRRFGECFVVYLNNCLLFELLFVKHLPARTAPAYTGCPHYCGFTVTFRHATPGTTPLDERSARLRRPDNTQHSQQTDIHAPRGIRTHNPSKRVATDPRLRPRRHQDRHLQSVIGTSVDL